MGKHFVEYVVVFLIIALSGFPFFSGSKEIAVIVFLFLLWICFKYKVVISAYEIYILLLFVVLDVLHGVLYSFSVVEILSTIVRFGFILMAVKFLHGKFFYKYVNLMAIFSLISLFFFVGLYFEDFTNYMLNSVAPYFGPPLRYYDTDAYSYSPNVLLYTFNPNVIFDVKRNSGPFWEPGGFGVFIIIAFIINLFLSKKFFSYINALFIVTCITTYSTATYIALAIVVFGWFLFESKVNLSWLIAIMLIPIFISLYNNLDFLGRKIEHNKEVANETTSSRFGSAEADIKIWETSPLFGKGRSMENIFGTDQEDLDIMHRNNGLTKFLVQYGLVGFIIYFFLFIKYFSHIRVIFHVSLGFMIFAFIAILSLAFSQVVLLFPVFLCFVFFSDKSLFRDSFI